MIYRRFFVFIYYEYIFKLFFILKMEAEPKTIKIKIGYEEFDQPFEIDFDENMTLETFRHLLGEAIGEDSQMLNYI